MKILVIGSGGREHAICWKIAQSAQCEKLYCAPGSDGIAEIAECVAIKADDTAGLLRFAREKGIGLTVVGPEAPLVAGIVDLFRKEGLAIFGPEKACAALEGSKVFAKELMKRFGVPTADFRVFDRYEDAAAYVEGRALPLVIKADGLAAGKGVVIPATFDEARDALKQMMVDKVFGHAGERVIIEECLKGEEASILVISDGKTILPLASSQDHKRVYDHDIGPNTGGMGAYSPAPLVTDALFTQILDTIVRPVIAGLGAEGKPYRGVLYAGVMVTDRGPMVLEFNARFGDPETQAILPRLNGDLVEVMARAAAGDLAGTAVGWDARPCVSVVLASGGYPGKFEKGMEIRGIDEAKTLADVVIFHAGTKMGRRFNDGRDLYLTDGGRILNVTALGADMPQAIERAYEAVRLISFDRMHYRKDIGAKAVRHAA